MCVHMCVLCVCVGGVGVTMYATMCVTVCWCVFIFVCAYVQWHGHFSDDVRAYTPYKLRKSSGRSGDTVGRSGGLWEERR